MHIYTAAMGLAATVHLALWLLEGMSVGTIVGMCVIVLGADAGRSLIRAERDA